MITIFSNKNHRTAKNLAYMSDILKEKAIKFSNERKD